MKNHTIEELKKEIDELIKEVKQAINDETVLSELETNFD